MNVLLQPILRRTLFPMAIIRPEGIWVVLPALSGTLPAGGGNRKPDKSRRFVQDRKLSVFGQIMGPSNFCNQWLQFFIRLVRAVKIPHVPDITGRKPFDARKLSLQVHGQVFYDRLYAFQITVAK
jgi:hypothetical protein